MNKLKVAFVDWDGTITNSTYIMYLNLLYTILKYYPFTTQDIIKNIIIILCVPISLPILLIKPKLFLKIFILLFFYNLEYDIINKDLTKYFKRTT